MDYLLKRGRGSRRRKAHLAQYDRLGNISGSLCGRSPPGGFDLSSNVPWGRPSCKLCRRELQSY